MKRRLRSGTLSVAVAIEHPDFASATVMEVLVAQKHWGVVRAGKLLARARVGQSRTCGGLTAKSREAVIDLLR